MRSENYFCFPTFMGTVLDIFTATGSVSRMHGRCLARGKRYSPRPRHKYGTFAFLYSVRCLTV